MHPPYLPLCVPCTSKIEFCHHLFIAAILSRHSVSGDHNKYCCLSHSFPTHMVNVHHLSHICRDLRVENMLLDTNMNIKLIGENSKCLIILLAILIISAAFIFYAQTLVLAMRSLLRVSMVQSTATHNVGPQPILLLKCLVTRSMAKRLIYGACESKI